MLTASLTFRCDISHSPLVPHMIVCIPTGVAHRKMYCAMYVDKTVAGHDKRFTIDVHTGQNVKLELHTYNVCY